jgi:hypothetical protein
LGAGDDQDLFELVEISCRVELDESVGLMIRVDLDGFDGADGQATGINLVAAGGKDLLAGLDAGVGGEIVDDDLTGGVSAENGTDACGGEDDAGPGGLVVDEKNLGGVIRKDIPDLADDAVGSDDSLVGLETVL